MSINVFEKLLAEKIDNFKLAFLNTAEDVFFDNNGKLIHPGEFGKFRENICKDFLRLIIPSHLDIGQGFIINTLNNISHQCDIVIYDSNNTPLLESAERQTFYPIETVAAVGEIKSTLSKTAFRETINKLSNLKKLREQVKHPAIIRREKQGEYDPKNYPYDQIFTFIICKKLDFDISHLTTEINEMYDQTVEYRHRHNLILSVEDGLLAYFDDNSKTMMYPKVGNDLKNRFTYPRENSYVHFKFFASYLFMGTSSSTILYPEITDYMGSINGGEKVDET